MEIKKENFFNISLLLFFYLLGNSIVYYIHIFKNKNIINTDLDDLSTISSLIIVVFISLSTITLVLLPKFIYFFVIKFIFNIGNIKNKRIVFLILLGYIPIFLNTIIINFIDFFTSLKVSGFWRSEEKYDIFGFISFYDLIDTFSIIIMAFLITRDIKGTHRDCIFMILGWLLIRIILGIFEEVI